LQPPLAFGYSSLNVEGIVIVLMGFEFLSDLVAQLVLIMGHAAANGLEKVAIQTEYRKAMNKFFVGRNIGLIDNAIAAIFATGSGW
jgi:hypothetical protein